MRLISKAHARLRDEESGFTLIELLIVLVIIAILLAIAIPSYLGFKDRANQRAAQANVRAAVPSAEAYYQDNNTYSGLTTTALRTIDSGLAKNLTVSGATSTAFCISGTVGNKNAHISGPGGTVKTGTC
jgi:type IV pilus assembly protein PilA